MLETEVKKCVFEEENLSYTILKEQEKNANNNTSTRE